MGASLRLTARPPPNGGQQLPAVQPVRFAAAGQLGELRRRASASWLIGRHGRGVSSSTGSSFSCPSLVLDILTSATNSAFFEVLAYIWGIGMWVWFSVQVGTTGSSPGMRVVGLKCVSKSTGQNIGTGTAILRWLLHIVDSIICFLGWFMADLGLAAPDAVRQDRRFVGVQGPAGGL